MKIKYLSDLHEEFYDFTEPKLSRWLDQCINFKQNFDVLVIAGDLCHWEELDTIKPMLESKLGPDRKLFYIPGNHEYYRGEKPIESFHNIMEIGDTVFIGCTLWFQDPDCETGAAYSDLNDYRRNKGMQNVNIINIQDKLFLKENITRYHALGYKVVAVTHHPPDPRCLDTYFLGDSVSRYYHNKGLQDVIPLCKAWIHGHRHNKLNLNIDGCLMLRNPLGYPDSLAISYGLTRNMLVEV